MFLDNGLKDHLGQFLSSLRILTALDRLFPSVRFDLQTRRLYTLIFEPRC